MEHKPKLALLAFKSDFSCQKYICKNLFMFLLYLAIVSVHVFLKLYGEGDKNLTAQSSYGHTIYGSRLPDVHS